MIDESAGTIAFTVTRTGDADGTQSVAYAIGGTVTGADLGGSLAGGTVTFAQGQTSQTITLDPHGRSARRAQRDRHGHAVEPDRHRGDADDRRPPRPRRPSSTTTPRPRPISVAGDSLSVDEGAGTVAFTVTRTGDAAGTQSVAYAIGGIVTGADLGGSLAGGTVTFAQGQTSQTITLTLTDDRSTSSTRPSRSRCRTRAAPR